mmetsp:Transcript_28786/g.73677  ORF Transcript_28786/g.73677 Transcript_28786/m.73677 type:complete len:124 (-) Transcript_28786:276-647(-)
MAEGEYSGLLNALMNEMSVQEGVSFGTLGTIAVAAMGILLKYRRRLCRGRGMKLLITCCGARSRNNSRANSDEMDEEEVREVDRLPEDEGRGSERMGQGRGSERTGYIVGPGGSVLQQVPSFV